MLFEPSDTWLVFGSVYAGKCTKGHEIGHCAQTISVTIATALPH